MHPNSEPGQLSSPYYWHRITRCVTFQMPMPMRYIRWVGWQTTYGRWYFHDVVNDTTSWSLPILASADSSDDTDGDASDVSQGQEATDSRADYRSQVSGLRSQVAEVDFMHGQVASDVSQVAASDSSQDAGVVDWSFSRAAVDFYTMD